MTPDPRLVAIRLRALQALNPPEHAAWVRAAKRVVLPDGTIDLSRGVNQIPDDAYNPDPYTVPAPDGSGYDTLVDILNALGGNFAPTNATFITQTPNGTLSAEQALSALATGLLKVTTATGVLSTAVANTDYLPVASPTATGTITLGGADSDTTIARGLLTRKSAAPSIANGVAIGTGGSVATTISGTNESGNLTIKAGTASLTTGRMATITLTVAHSGNYRILLTPTSAQASANAVQWTAAGLTSTTWGINCAVAPVSGGQYDFYYDLTPWTN